MLLRCPHCASPEVEPSADRAEVLACENCGATFQRSDALVSLAAADAYAEDRSVCTCSASRGCPQCFGRADEMVGALVRDAEGREWEVREADEKDGFPTVCGDEHWAYLNEVMVVRRPSQRTYASAAFPLYPDGKTGDQLVSTRGSSIATVLSDLGALLECSEIDPEAEALELTLTWESS